MSERKLKLIHLVNTAWLILCVGYIVVLALRQAGFGWWVIFSLSGHSALLAFLLMCLYLFAVFRGTVRRSEPQIEHPLTSATCYVLFYALSPLLGAVAGLVAMTNTNRITQQATGIALGTLGTTFLVWIILDPSVGLLEMLLPAGREHRRCRIAEAKAERTRQQLQGQRLLAEVLASEKLQRNGWLNTLKPEAEYLAELLTNSEAELEQTRLEAQAVEIGARAWKMGGLNCMRTLHDMAADIRRQSKHPVPVIDYIPAWWDGIGSWRCISLEEGPNLLLS